VFIIETAELIVGDGINDWIGDISANFVSLRSVLELFREILNTRVKVEKCMHHRGHVSVTRDTVSSE